MFSIFFSFLSFSFFSSVSFCDAANAWQFSFQDPATPVVEGMLIFHDFLCFFLVFIGLTTFWVLLMAIKTFNEVYSLLLNYRFSHSNFLEIFWTFLPAISLLIIAVPSFALLYSLDELVDPKMTLKVVGSQWFWSYEYSDSSLEFFPGHALPDLNFDSYMVPTDELVKGSFRLLEVDNRVTLPVKTHIRVLVTATDVLHSFAVPSFGVKVDACPGRLSQSSLFIKRPGIYFGQCSEICGVNHGFMPIVIKGVCVDSYVSWVLHQHLAESPVTFLDPSVACEKEGKEQSSFYDKGHGLLLFTWTISMTFVVQWCTNFPGPWY